MRKKIIKNEFPQPTLVEEAVKLSYDRINTNNDYWPGNYTFAAPSSMQFTTLDTDLSEQISKAWDKYIVDKLTEATGVSEQLLSYRLPEEYTRNTRSSCFIR
jgi:hypothetical protein